MEEETKCCSKCKIIKNLNCFSKRKISKDGFYNICKLCRAPDEEGKMKNRKAANDFYKRNSEKIREYRRGYYNNNLEAEKERNKIYRENPVNKEKIKQTQSLWRKENSAYSKYYSVANEDKIKEKCKIYYQNNKEKINKKQKEYYSNNKEKISKRLRDKHKESPHIRAWRGVLASSLRRLGKKKESQTIELLGYSTLELKLHIESLFTEGMSWDNYGEWHIDHIKSVFEFSGLTDVSIVNSLSNLRPLWATTREINGVIYEGNLNRHKS